MMGKTSQTQNPPLPPHLLLLSIWSWSVQWAQQHSCSTLRNNSSKVYVCTCERGMGYVVKEYCSFSTAELSIVPRLLYTRVLLSRTARQKIQPSFLESPWNTQSLQIKSLIQNTMQLNLPSEVQWQAEPGKLLVVVSDCSHLCHVPKSLCVQQHKSVSFFTGVRDTPHPDALGLWFNSAAESKAWDNHSISIMQLVFRCSHYHINIYSTWEGLSEFSLTGLLSCQAVHKVRFPRTIESHHRHHHHRLMDPIQNDFGFFLTRSCPFS